MPLDKDTVLFGSAGVGLGAWLLLHVVRLFRGEVRGHRSDAAENDVIKSLREELSRKDDQLEAKELTIQRLVKEKAAEMERLAELPALSERIHDLEEHVLSLIGLFNHLIDAGALSLAPEHQRMVLNLMTKQFNREGQKNEAST